MKPVVPAVLLACSLAPLLQAAGAPLLAQASYEDVCDLMAARKRIRRQAAKRLIAAGDERILPGITDALFFIPAELRGEALDVLRQVSGHDGGRRYHDWVEYIGSRADLDPLPGYRDLKVSLLQRIDRRYPSSVAAQRFREAPGADGRARVRSELSTTDE